MPTQTAVEKLSAASLFLILQMARWSSGLRLRPLTPATGVRIPYGSPLELNRLIIVGVVNDEGPPVPIPNTEVKLISADNTWLATAREDRKTPTPKHICAICAYTCFGYIPP